MPKANRSDLLRGQLMTIIPVLTGPLTKRFPKVRRDYLYQAHDRQRGETPIIGDFYPCNLHQRAKGLRILLHGISSNHRSPYLAPHVKSGLSAGDDVLSIALRGVLGRGHDHFHAGLTNDLHEVIADPDLSGYQEISLIGCSMGGLVTLNFALECKDSRVRGVAAICPPIQLDVIQAHLDQPQQALYRRLILSRIKTPYQSIWHNAQRAQMPLGSDLQAVLSARSIEEWDRVVILPRFAFESTDEYYAQVSISTAQLQEAPIPTLLVFDRGDPMIPLPLLNLTENLVKPSYESLCTIKFTRGGGHINFPRALDLGYEGSLGIAGQVGAWFNTLK